MLKNTLGAMCFSFVFDTDDLTLKHEGGDLSQQIPCWFESLRPKLLVLSRAVSNSTLEYLLRSRPKTPTVTGYLFQNPDTYTIHPKV